MHISEGVLSPPVLAAGWALAAGGLALGLKKTKTETLPRTALISAVLFLASLVHVPLGPSSIHLTLLGLAGLLLGWSAIPALFTALLLQGFLFQFGGLLSLGVNTTIMGTAALSGYALYSLIGRSATGTLHPSLWHEKGVQAGEQGASDHIILKAKQVAIMWSDRAFRSNSPDHIISGSETEGQLCGQANSASIPCARKRPAVIYAAAFIAGFLAIIVGSLLVIIALALSDMNLKTIAALIFAANIPLALVEGAITVFIVSFLAKLYPRALKL